MTSRELADAIDQLIILRVEQQTVRGKPELWGAAEDLIELRKRQIADALKRLDHNGGVYAVGQDACGKEQV